MDEISTYLTQPYLRLDNKPKRIGFRHSLYNSDQWTSDGEYTKSNKLSDYYDGGIYMLNEPIPYVHRIYETFIDSRGNKHSVQVAYEDKKIKISEEHFEILNHKNDDPDIRITSECPIDPTVLCFQFNLRRYILIYWDRGFSHLSYIRNIISNKKDKTPEIFSSSHWYKTEAMESSGFAPFYEYIFNGYTNYIPDRIFFNYQNRQQALNRIHCGIQSMGHNYNDLVFKDFDYVNASDSELIKFMNDRFRRRLKFEQKINAKSYYNN